MAARQAAAFLTRFLRGRTSGSVARQALPGAAINAAIGLVTGGPGAAIAYGAGDFLLNYPLMRTARRLRPGTQEAVTNLATGEITKRFSPSALETGANITASILSPIVTDVVTGGAFIPKEAPTRADDQAAIIQQQQQSQLLPIEQAQEQQMFQQLMQRHNINKMGLGQMALSPGTMYQMQGIEQTAFHYPGVTLPPDLKELIET